MKMVGCLVACCLFSLALCIPRASAQSEYTIVNTSGGPRVCIGQWIPPRKAGTSGTCLGSLMDLSELTALSSRQSVDRLDQLLVTLNSMDQKMAVNLDQVNRLIDETRNTQSAIYSQIQQSGRLLHETITRRFEALPEEILSNELFREELSRLKADILREVDMLYEPRAEQEVQ